ncbi:hypothetical protein ES708_26871 [subsurface metagenome]
MTDKMAELRAILPQMTPAELELLVQFIEFLRTVDKCDTRVTQ